MPLAAEGSHGLVKAGAAMAPDPGERCRRDSVRGPSSERCDQRGAGKLDRLDLDHGRSPVLIIIDTLARTFGGGDENKQNDMNAYVSAVDRLKKATGAHVMIVHHSGVHENARERGSNVLRGAADTVIKVERKGNDIRLINKGPGGNRKMRPSSRTSSSTRSRRPIQIRMARSTQA